MISLKQLSQRKYLVIVAVLAVVAVGGGVSKALLFGGTAAPVSSSDIELQRGLVGWWKMNGNAKDSTPYANDGTASSHATLTTDREGASNSAYSFNGASGVINVGNGSSLTMGKSDWSLSAWIKTTATGGIVFCKRSGGPLDGYNLLLSGGKASARFDSTTTAVSVTVTGATTVNDNNWHLLTATFNRSGNLTLYVDGAVDGSADMSAYASNNITTSKVLLIGEDTFSGSNWFLGSIDDARVYKRALSTAEVSALYHQYDTALNAGSGENGLVGLWKLDGNGKDSSPYGNNGTVSGATLTTDRKGTANSAYSFNGSSQYITVANNSIFKPTANISVGAWIKPSNVSSTSIQSIISTTESGSYQLSINGSSSNAACNSNTICFLIDVAGTYKAAQISKSSLSNGVWYHIFGTYNGSTVALYINGSLVNSTSATGSITEVTTPLCLGDEASSGSCTGGQYYAGSLDDVRIYSRSLSSTEISSIYNSYNSQISLYGATASGQTTSLSQGLLGYWNFNGNAKDSTPYGNNGTVSGTTLTTDRRSRASSAYSFAAASSQYIDMGNVDDAGTGSYSVSLWFKETNSGVPSNTEFLVSKGNNASGNRGWSIIHSSTGGSLTVRLNGSDDVTQRASSAVTVTDTNWHQVVMVVDRSANKVIGYLDGSNTGWTAGGGGPTSDDITGFGTLTNSNHLFVGVSPTSNLYFNGKLDDIRIYNRALSADEVSTLYSSYY